MNRRMRSAWPPLVVNLMNSGCAPRISRRVSPSDRESEEDNGGSRNCTAGCYVLGELASVPILVLFILLALIMCLSMENKQASNNAENSD